VKKSILRIGFCQFKKSSQFCQKKKNLASDVKNTVGNNFPLKVGKIDLNHITMLYKK